MGADVKCRVDKKVQKHCAWNFPISLSNFHHFPTYADFIVSLNSSTTSLEVEASEMYIVILEEFVISFAGLAVD